jgi:hypothetical protein
MNTKSLLVVFLLMGFPVFADDKPPEVATAAEVVGPTQSKAAEAEKPKTINIEATKEDLALLDDTEKAGLNWWQLLLKHLMELVFTLLGLIGTALVTVLFKKYKFQEQTDKINDLLMRAIGFAEQKSKKAAKLDGSPKGSTEKLELAIQFAQNMAKEYKLPAKSQEWWEDKLEAWLGVTNK